MTITPGVAGFVKGLLTVILAVVVSYLADAANLQGLLNPALATVVAGVFAAIESSLKAKSGGEKGLFGAVRISRS